MRRKKRLHIMNKREREDPFLRFHKKKKTKNKKKGDHSYRTKTWKKIR